MDILYFKNSSGDDVYPICQVDCNLTKEEIAKIVAKNIGDDFIPIERLSYPLQELDEEERFAGGEICGEYWIESFDENLEKASNLIEKKTSKDWYEIEKEIKGLIILDPDGWDRKNYEYSFEEELITYNEFKIRATWSSCVIDPTIIKK